MPHTSSFFARRVTSVAQRLTLVGACVSLGIVVSGCSIVMAMKGAKEPDMKILEVGATRGQIELQLGAPKKSTKTADGGSIDDYRVELGNEPSPMRAVLHGVADVLTLCIWEAPGTLIESMQGVIRTIEVTYDSNDYAASVRVISEEPSGLFGPEKEGVSNTAVPTTNTDAPVPPQE